MIGSVYPTEKFAFTDPDTGAEIMQYTTQGETNRTLYFTNRPYTADGEHVVFLSNRSGRNEMYLLHLISGKIVQLTDLPGQTHFTNCIHPHRPELYFHDTSILYRVDWERWQTEPLMQAPDGWRIGILNMNAPPWLVFEVAERCRPGMRHPVTGEAQAKVEGFVGNESYYMRDRTLLYRLNVETGELDCLWGDYKSYSHVQMSPTNSNLVVFSSWAGYGDDRCYYLDLTRRSKVTPRSMFPESPTARGGHECFTRRGNLYIQWIEGDLEPGERHTMYHGFRQITDAAAQGIEAAPFVKYELPSQAGPAADYCVHHFTMSDDEAWGLHDRWMSAPAYGASMSWLSLFRHQAYAPQTRDLKLCFHDGFANDVAGVGVNATLDANDEWATYTSFLKGTANICQVKVKPLVERLMTS